MDYTNVKNKLPPLKDFPSPSLIYHKWQGYDRFAEERRNNKELKAFATDHQKDYLKDIIKYVHKAKEKQSGWIHNYLSYLTDLGNTIIFYSFCTNWRLVVGMGTNPTLETGIQLHHLYGFPYIPGSSVKGMLHHEIGRASCRERV